MDIKEEVVKIIFRIYAGDFPFEDDNTIECKMFSVSCYDCEVDKIDALYRKSFANWLREKSTKVDFTCAGKQCQLLGEALNILADELEGKC